MQGVLNGFAVIVGIIAVGYVVGRRGHLGPHGQETLTRLAFHVATPALLFTTLARADLSLILSARLAVTALCTAATAAVFVLFAVLAGWDAGRTVIGALCSSYINAGNLGLPIAAYVLGDASLIAPVLLLQQIVITPVALTVLDLTADGADRQSLLSRVTTPLRNPMGLGSLAGVTVAATGWTVPAPVLDPVTLIGDMSVPAVLIALGVSLCGSSMPGAPGPERKAVLLSVALKSFAQPTSAWLLGSQVFGLRGAALLAVVVVAALPSAQNMYTYASRYGVGERLARESVLLSTLVSAPVMVAVAALLG